MDHKDKHHQHHEHNREEKKEEQKKYEAEQEKRVRTIHPAFFVMIGVVLIALIVVIWTLAF